MIYHFSEMLSANNSDDRRGVHSRISKHTTDNAKCLGKVRAL